MLMSKKYQEQSEANKEALILSGKKVSDKYYTVRQFLAILVKNKKIAPNLLSKGNIVKFSKLAKNYCEENNWHYVKSSRNSIKMNHGKQVSSYPLEALKEVYLNEFNNNKTVL